MNTQPHNEHTFARTLKLFLVLALPLAAVLIGFLATFYRSESNAFLDEIKVEEQVALRLQQTSIGINFRTVVSDLMYLSNKSTLCEHDAQEDPTGGHSLPGEYLLLSKTKGLYDQIRFLDNQGMEKVRVNYNAGRPEVVQEQDLQNKFGRYYFQEAIVLDKGQVFISALDLNVENNEVETPLKPTIRFATPVFDQNGMRQGVVVLNYLASTLLNDLKTVGLTTRGHSSLLNEEGYWLQAPDKDLEWGFMFKDKVGTTFGSRFPEEWKAMQAMGQGVMQTENGLFTFATVYPLQILTQDRAAQGVLKPSQYMYTKNYRWMLVTHSPPEVLGRYKEKLQDKLALYGFGLFLVAGIGAWALAFSMTKRRLYQAQLVKMAQFDALTGLPNRALFFDRLHVAIEHADRHKTRLGLLYIDLDGFKAVNDTLGHDAGDELLVKVAEVLRGHSRKSDTVARLGGDEFAMLLFEIADTQNAKMVADKIIAALCEPMIIKSTTVVIGASIGAAVYPDHADADETLVKAADEAMYQAKSGGKNRCVPAGE